MFARSAMRMSGHGASKSWVTSHGSNPGQNYGLMFGIVGVVSVGITYSWTAMQASAAALKAKKHAAHAEHGEHH